MRWGAWLVPVLLIAGCSSSGGSSTYPHAAYRPVVLHVAYHLSGSATQADITYLTGSGGTEQQQGIDVPMVNKAGGDGLFFTAQPGDFLYFSAQNGGEFGSLTCTITENGRVISRQTSTGGYSIVTCQGAA